MKNKAVIITGICCITVLEAIALLKGVNGVLLTGAISAIVGVVCLAIPTPNVLKL